MTYVTQYIIGCCLSDVTSFMYTIRIYSDHVKKKLSGLSIQALFTTVSVSRITAVDLCNDQVDKASEM